MKKYFQVFHICDEGRKVSFLCPNGTIFQQSDLICDWWFKVDCASSPALYQESAEHLEEENNKRKEARKAQEAKRAEELKQRLAFVPRAESLRAQSREIPNLELSQSREIYNQRRQHNNHRYVDQNIVAKKDINAFVGIPGIEVENRRKPDKVYKETQIPAETASFVSKKFNDQQNYFKSTNDLGANKVNYLPQRTHADNRATKPVIDKPTRGGKTFEATLTTSKPYRGRNNDYLKTTTQHTIYSPTVPPYTASKFTTRIPSTKPFITTTEFFRTKSSTTSPTTTTSPTPSISPKPKSLTGFFITKVAESTTHGPNAQSLKAERFFEEKDTVTRSPTTYKGEFTTKIPDSTIPVKIETLKPHSSRALESNFGSYDFTKHDYSKSRGSTLAIHSTTPYNTVFTTITPTGYTSRDTTYIDNTTENSKTTTSDDKDTTNRFNQYTYLPKSTDQSSTVRPTNPTPYTAYTTPASVTDNLSNMIKTLQNLDSQDPNMDIEKLLITRPGLNIPPSAGPNTLHSLAVYFATALDNLVATNETYPEVPEKTTTTEPPPTTITEEDRFVTLLSRSTVDKYNLLFNDNHTEEKPQEQKNEKETLDLKHLVEHDVHYNDLDGQQSQGPLSSTPRIRQLAQVFTQALSAYLDDPETFKRVLEEIRPTEPPLIDDTDYTVTETSQTVTPLALQSETEYSSYTKEEDEVLDFSDSDKTSTHSTSSTTTPITTTTTTTTTTSTTERPYINEISTVYPNDNERFYNQPTINIERDSRAQTVNTVNSLAVDLNNNLRYSLPTTKQTTTTESPTTESSYLPINEPNNEDELKRLTGKPYGFGVAPKDSTPITDIPQTTTDNWSSNYNQINTNLSEFQPFDALLPPFELPKVNKTHRNEEYLQSAHSQSFLSRGNSLTDRKGKVLNTKTTDSTTDYRYQTTTNQYETTSIYSTTDYETTTNYYSSTVPTTDATTEDLSTTTDSTTLYPSTQGIPQNHWSTSPIVTKLWETTLYVNPLLINRNLDIKSEYNSTSTEYDITSTTEPYDFSTQENFYKTTTETDDKYYTSTTEDYSTTESLELLNYPPSAEGIHNLLNSTELEIASSQANQLFGNLDLTEQDLLMEKMKMAESNSTVRRLILLLVSTCDASLNHNKTVQETRNYILHALLGVPLNKSLDSHEKSEIEPHEETDNLKEQLKSRSGKAITPEVVPVTTTPESTTVDIVTSSRSYIITDKKQILAKAQVPNKVNDVKNVHQNTRALELLRSLYSLAAKWSKK